MPRALKVYRTPIGFHDAYVAAPSQKAALEAWGADANLFARGVAEIVTDAALTKEPLADPGKVIKRARGSAAEHFDALPKTKAKPASPPKKSKPKKVTSRPSRAKLDAAKTALTKAEQQYQDGRAELRKREEALRHEREALDKQQDAAAAKLRKTVEQAQSSYDRALAKWRD